MRSALIVGASGQDGRLLNRLLLGRGYAVRGWTRTSAAAPRVSGAAIDVLDGAAVEAEIRAFHPDEIYYLAAFHHSTEDHVELTAAELLHRSFEVHVHGLVNLLQAIKSSSPSTRLFYAASSHVFGNPATDVQDEQTPFRPHSAYGISKAAAVQCCRLYREQ
jgi:GDPmannose 4,6-dehydratase